MKMTSKLHKEYYRRADNALTCDDAKCSRVSPDCYGNTEAQGPLSGAMDPDLGERP